MTAERLLFWLVRWNAGVILLAAPCVLLPFEWMDAIHRDLLGFGTLPDLPITNYLARSLCLAYALHGAFILSLTFDWVRYRPFIPTLARLHLVFGGAMMLLDWFTPMPWWWLIGEGPTIIAFAVLILAVNQRASRSGEC